MATRATDRGLNGLRGLLAHQSPELSDDRPFGGFLPEHQARDGDHDHQDRRDREDGVIRDRRAAGQRDRHR